MKHLTIEEQADEILLLFRESCRPFPYAGCRALIRDTGKAHEDFIPDLDLYFSEIAGYCSWGRKILMWPKEKLSEVQSILSRSFFEKHPQYQTLQSAVNKTETPDLYESLKLYEKMRGDLADLISRLLFEQYCAETSGNESGAAKISSVTSADKRERKKVIA